MANLVLSAPMDLQPLRLKKNEDNRLRAGHLWVFSNEIDTVATPLNGFEPGQAVLIFDHRGHTLGTGYVNPRSLIAARVVSRDSHYVLDKSLIAHRVNVALSLRESLFAQPYYRLVYSESDGLPGLVVDRFDDVLVAQITTAGMERCKNEIVEALQQVLRPATIIFRNDTSIRELEGLDSYVETCVGIVPDTVKVEENGARFDAPLLQGQKTGWFYDHRLNRLRMHAYVRNKSVLDVFSYIGGWGIQAALAGADHVSCVDSSALACAQVRHHAVLNGVENKVSILPGDAFDVLKVLRTERRHFDVVILDPPAFVKRKKDIESGKEAYRRLIQMAMQVLAKDGILMAASCSYHLTTRDLQNILLQSSRHLDRNLQILEQGHQGPDHPVHPAIPETAYLKCFITRVLSR